MSSSYTEQSLVNGASAHSIAVERATLDRDVEVRAPVLNAALLARIRHLNLDYLELLVAERDSTDSSTQLQHLPPRQRAALCALSPRALRALAEMPYSLYSLGFEDENFWNAVCDNATSSASALAVQRYARVGDASAQCSFCELALLHAWHVAGKNTMAARMVYAMPHATAKRLVNTPLWQIRCIAGSYGELMMPRWPTNPAFWPDLIRFAAANDTRRLHMTRLLGTQLIAAELEVACEISRQCPRIAPALASPRLRARKLQLAPRVSVGKKTSIHDEESK
ncbi:hypothetical protein GCM10011487_01240 [Steroidobacter agaridevorans]|uniref:Uncharacterized protein n=1 Tax=Steroidobacter agaridevorans TaxID=2695856 RepID=A0A829Y4L2_9GAMM|nr:hypothetical protein [Steroidobacter agaridevorans]GFE78124.1 hypothetical protein GCM10011487_01240 [Steroidobacter agaridevorans]GFE91183.1 hypothetical protein GCM10011488_61370 [Steroidobacter agaridevorans]